MIDSPQVKTIADRLGKTPAQVLIAWGAKSGFFVIPKSVTPERIKASLFAGPDEIRSALVGADEVSVDGEGREPPS